jgi:Raf kinase inhibitor-like YbhB/YbcL family protein
MQWVLLEKFGSIGSYGIFPLIYTNSIPKNSIEGETDFGEIGYGGPAPPDKEHTYIFKLYAINTVLDLSKGSTKQDLENSIQGHIIDETKLTGKYAPQ